MKVLFVTHDARDQYGATRSLLNLLEGLGKLDVSGIVVAPEDGQLRQSLRFQHFAFHVSPYSWWMSRNQSFWGKCERAARNLRGGLSVARIAMRHRVQAIYTNSLVTPVGFLASRVTRLPHVWHLREFGDLDHGLTADCGTKLQAALVCRSQAIICVSQAVKQHTCGRDCGRAQVIYNGVKHRRDFDTLRQRRTGRSRGHGVFRFLIVGRLCEGKNQLEGIEALSRLRALGCNATLQLVGHGDREYVSRCQGAVEAYRLGDSVEFCGYRADAVDVMTGGDALIMCSRNEGMGRVTVEAMGVGLPVIGYAAGGTLELVEAGVNGLLYSGGASDLARCMEKCVLNPAWADRLGDQAWNIARDKYSIERCSSEVHAVLGRLIHKHP